MNLPLANNLLGSFWLPSGTDVRLLAPELALAATMVLVLLVPPAAFVVVPSASPASPQTTRLPDCAMKADMCPILPCTTISMPFMEMPQREEALPSMTSSPPCPVAPAD